MYLMIVIDGSYHEGGGQIVRTSVGLAALLGKDIRIENIRAKRPNPGLAEQHVCAINAVAEMSSAKIKGVFVGSKAVEFSCNRGWSAKDAKINMKIPTAGAIGLAIQPLLIAASGTGGKIMIDVEGGATFGKWAPPVPYVQKVFARAVSFLGYNVRVDVERHGFYPRGGGLTHVEILPAKQKRAVLDVFEENASVRGVSVASRDLSGNKVAERQKERALQILNDAHMFGDVMIDIAYSDSVSTGSGIVLWTEKYMFLGASALGERGKRAEDVGEEAAIELCREYETKACVDKHLCDQLIPFLAICGGSLRTSEITKHTETNIRIVEKLTDATFNVNNVEKTITARRK